MKRKVMHIEVSESDNGFKARIGDIRGALTLSNVTKEGLLKRIGEAIEAVFEG